jgi:UDP-N-acetylmuramoylalanine--D-glutamate ligase
MSIKNNSNYKRTGKKDLKVSFQSGEVCLQPLKLFSEYSEDTINGLASKKVLVLGLGKSGISALKKLSELNCRVIAADSDDSIKMSAIKRQIRKKEFEFELIADKNINSNCKILKGVDLVIISPGISNDIAIILEADRKKIPVWSEIEFAWRFLDLKQKKNTIAVTGTNGKTTTVTLIDKILQNSGKKSMVCGNIGNPLLSTLKYKNRNLVRVIEISSFQLERCISFNPFVSLILNITSDHLDRHHTLDNYAEIKFSIFKNASGKNWAIFNIDDSIIAQKLSGQEKLYKNKVKVIRYSILKKDSEIFYKDKFIFYSICKIQGHINISNAILCGNHNILNMMAAVAAAKAFNIPDGSIENTINTFIPLEHRQEYVCTINGIRVYNDSKATNPDATIKALESFDRQVTLILGGKDKDMDFSVMLPCLDQRVLNLILIGQTKIKMLRMLENHEKQLSGLPYNVFVCQTFEEAVEKGLEVTQKNNVLMLSPACASFDMFKSYRDRGNKFKDIILKNNK